MNVPKHSRLFSRVWPKRMKNSFRAAAASARLSRGATTLRSLAVTDAECAGPAHSSLAWWSSAAPSWRERPDAPSCASSAGVPLDTSGSASGGVPLDALRRVGRLVRLPDPHGISTRSASDRWRQLPPIPRSPNRPMRRLAGPYFDTARAGFLAPGDRKLKHAILQRGVDLR